MPTFGLINVSVGGIYLTLYRIAIPVAFLCMFAVQRFTIDSFRRRPHVYWVALLVVWILYGAVLLVFSTYSNAHDGLLEIISLAYGLMVMVMFTQFEMNEPELRRVFAFVRFVLYILIAIGLVEITTGQHLPTSFYYDANRAELLETNPYMATGFMHNVNDFSALITCLLPACLLSKRKAPLVICTFFVLIINAFNDATICNFAIAIAIAVYVASLIKGQTHCSVPVAVLCAIAATVVALLVIDVMFLFAMGYGISQSVVNQIDNLAVGQGSFHYRLGAYDNALKATVDSAFLGVGPAGFTNYCIANRTAYGLVNPHAFLLETLSEYGIVVFAMLVYALFKTAKTAVTAQQGIVGGNGKAAAIGFVLLLFVVSFAPSSFIGFSFTWLIMALACCLLSCAELEGDARGHQ